MVAIIVSLVEHEPDEQLAHPGPLRLFDLNRMLSYEKRKHDGGEKAQNHHDEEGLFGADSSLHASILADFRLHTRVRP